MDMDLSEMSEGSQGPSTALTAGSGDLGLLIELIQSYECLYNLQSQNYKNAKIKEASWNEISSIMNMSVDECMRHWKNLRDRFNKEKKNFKSGSEAPESNWPYFNKMLFYGQFSKPRKTFSATPSTSRAGSCTPSASRAGSSTPNTSRPGSRMDIQSPYNTMEAILKSPEDSPLTSPTVPETPAETWQDEVGKRRVENIPEMANAPKGKRKKKEGDPELLVMVAAAEKIANTFQAVSNENLSKGKATSNRTFAEYAYSRLEEMGPEKAKKKRRQMLLILEDEDE